MLAVQGIRIVCSKSFSFFFRKEPLHIVSTRQFLLLHFSFWHVKFAYWQTVFANKSPENEIVTQKSRKFRLFSTEKKSTGTKEKLLAAVNTTTDDFLAFSRLLSSRVARHFTFLINFRSQQAYRTNRTYKKEKNL